MSSQSFLDTSRAFDSVAADYDGTLGNNALVQKMRVPMMQTIERNFPRGARLLDLGCGAGIDAEYLAARGYEIHALDSSPAMAARTQARLEHARLTQHAHADNIGIHELEKLDAQNFDGAYSDLGPLNCVPDLRAVSQQLARKLKPNGLLIASALGRYVPWEILYYARRGDFKRVGVRFARASVPVPMNGLTVWTHYYAPREFARAFADEFELMSVRALALFVPPPYLIRVREKFPRAVGWLERIDHALGAKPFFREAGDHFLIMLRKKN